MPLSIEQVDVDTYAEPMTTTPAPARQSSPAVDIERIRRELRREAERRQRLWAD